MNAQHRLLIRTVSAGLYCGLLVICACSDSVTAPSVYQPGERRPEAWMGHYASVTDTVVMDGTCTLTSVHAQLDLYTAPACQLYATFSTEEPDDWAYYHSDNCLYYMERGVVILELKMRVHYPGGTDVVEGGARFEPVDADWTAVVWKNIGIRLERDPVLD